MDDPIWRGSLTLGSGWALFVGWPGENEEHAHYAHQLCRAGREAFELDLEGDRSLRARDAAIASGTPHALRWPRCPGALLYLDPDGDRGRAIGLALERSADKALWPGIVIDRGDGEGDGPDGAGSSAFDALEHARDDLSSAVSLRDRLLARWTSIEATRATAPSPRDPRVVAVCTLIRARIGDSRIPAAILARAVDLSTSRLFALFRRETGLALRPYLLWCRIERAIVAVSDGHSLTEAAAEAGFADSAHLARTFRRMFGTSFSRGMGDLAIRVTDA